MHKIRPAREAPRDTLAVFKGSTSEKTGEGDGRRTGEGEELGGKERGSQ